MQINKKHDSSTKDTPASILQRYAYIDALRGIAILGVLLAHVSHYSNVVYPSWLQIITAVDFGPRGVQLFYVVSAFTLCLSLNKRKHIEKHAIRNFYIRRFFRIAPLFYLAILYYLWQQNYWQGNPFHFSILNILSTVTFINGIFPAWINNIVYGGWSIAVETSFYLLFPLLFYKLKTFRLTFIFTIIAIVAMQSLRLYLLSLSLIHQNFDLQTYTFEFFPSQLPVFLIGIVVFFMMHENIVNRYKKQLKFFLVAVGLLLVLQELLPLKLVPGHYTYGLLFGSLLFTLSKYPYKLLVNKVIVYIGKISFSLYLCHTAVDYWMTKLGLYHYLPANPYLNFMLHFFILLVAASGIASILFFTVEKWGIILGKKIINKYEKVTPTYIASTARTW
ncbi:MAG TPA: acyltransferase [Candidatus Sulfotelmatobacter sp.]|jgi:peptidoglycan/LPS O-acetylase OafA/YrhL|nr:acyltransferase [Candidatus Sulfotelmatobacter sp.]